MHKKKILVFIDWFLPGYKAGGPITSVANMTERLSRYFDFYIITSDRDYTETESYPGVTANRWTNFKDGVHIYYLSKANTDKKHLKELIKSVDFDTVYINGIYSYFFSILPLMLVKNSGKKIIVCARGMLSKQAFSRKSFKKKLFLMLAKLRGLYKKVIFHATNEHEKQDILEKIGDKAQVYIAANLPKSYLNNNWVKKKKSKGELKLVSIARISQEKNTKFALQSLEKLPDGKIEFDLYGSIHDQAYWQECRQIIEALPPNIKVNYKGPVSSQKVTATFQNYHIAFMPSLGENFGHSLLESMAAGTPVITSTGTPWRKLQKHRAGWDIDLSRPEAFINTLRNCVQMTQSEYDSLSKSTFNYASKIVNDEQLAEHYKTLF